MKKLILLFLAFLLLDNVVFSQISSSIKVTGDTDIEPGVNNSFTATVTNTESIDLIDPRGEYQIWMIYKGSGNAGLALNKQVKLGEPLGAKKSRPYRIDFTGPILPGEYDVEIVFKRGSKVVSNVVKLTLVVEANYEVDIAMRSSSYTIHKGSTRVMAIRFMIKNIGKTAWPEGKYSLHFRVKTTPPGASKDDKEAFNISPKNFETWEFDPGAEEEFVYDDFKPPYTDGAYVVIVTLMFNGKEFDAEGNAQPLTFKINVR